jgi:adenine-specific DNA-methyltransferase
VIQKGERVFYTNKNAKKIDNAMDYIHTKVEKDIQHFLLAPLLSEASIHANTSGVFKGFYKDSDSGKGQFGGNGKNALDRILGDIKLELPVASVFKPDAHMYNKDINDLINEIDHVDVAYFDPPYNQHPYGSNYFMLNIIAKNERPLEISKISGIPTNWNKSKYNKRKDAETFLDHLIDKTKASYIILSYNDEGIIPIDVIKDILGKYGSVTLIEKEYNAFRGSRNLKGRSNKVKELLFVLQKNINE